MDRDKRQLINEILYKVRLGDEESIFQLHDLIAPTIRYIALNYLQNQHDADDLVQDFWLNIEKYAKGFVFHKNAYGYLCKVMTRLAINRCKKLNREYSSQGEFVDYLKIENYEANDELAAVELRGDINKAMLKLSKEQCIIIQKTYFQDKTIRQIAKEMGMSKSQVDRLKRGAIEILKEELSKKGWDKSDS